LSKPGLSWNGKYCTVEKYLLLGQHWDDFGTFRRLHHFSKNLFARLKASFHLTVFQWLLSQDSQSLLLRPFEPFLPPHLLLCKLPSQLVLCLLDRKSVV
jgi:hypothetical protein